MKRIFIIIRTQAETERVTLADYVIKHLGFMNVLTTLDASVFGNERERAGKVID